MSDLLDKQHFFVDQYQMIAIGLQGAMTYLVPIL